MSEKRFNYLIGARGVMFCDKDEMISYSEVCEILNKVDEQQEQIDLLEKNREKLNKWLDEYVDKFTEVWRIVEPYRRG